MSLRENLKEDATHIWGIFHDLKEPDKKNPPRHRLCKIREATHKSNGKKRNAGEYDSYLDALFAKKLQELTREFDQKMMILNAKTEGDKHYLKDAIQKYRIEYMPGLKPSSVQGFKKCLSYWEERLGDKRLSEITPSVILEEREMIQNGRERRRKGEPVQRSNGTTNKYVQVLSSVFQACKLDYHWFTGENPCKQIRHLKLPKGRNRDPLTMEEMEALMKACKDHSVKLYSAVALALSTGGRQLEVWGLKKADVDYKDGFITFRDTKNGDTRTVAVIPAVLERLKELRQENPFDPYVFPPKQRRSSNTKHYKFTKPFNQAVKDAGIENFTWHHLRHCAASFFVMTGTPDMMIMKIMGWRKKEMLGRYAHLRPKNIHEATQEMAEKFLPNF